MNQMHPKTIAALRELLRNGPTTIDELEVDGARQVIVNLLTHKLVEGASGYRKGPRIYTITEKGLRVIKSMETPQGDVALPRQSTMSGTFTGVRWNIREKADQHKDCPSRSGDSYNAWTPPILIAGKPEQRV